MAHRLGDSERDRHAVPRMYTAGATGTYLHTNPAMGPGCYASSCASPFADAGACSDDNTTGVHTGAATGFHSNTGDNAYGVHRRLR